MRLAASGEARNAPADARGDAERRALLAGARIAIVGAGYPGKRFLYERARDLGVELVLVDATGTWSEPLVGEGIARRFVGVDVNGDADAAAGRALAALGREHALDGAMTFFEDAGPIAARVAAALGLPGAPPAAADAARSKQRTLEASRRAGLPTPAFTIIDGRAGLATAAAMVGFPAVVKPVFGAEAMGCLRVDDLPGLVATYDRVAAIVNPALDAIFEQGTDLLLEEYLDGTEFDVDLLVSDGVCVFSTVSENWPTAEPYFVETGLHTPSLHPPERLGPVVELCFRTVLALGFRDGLFHVEAKDTTRGPRILEVNARLGGGHIADFHRLVTGVDLIEQQLLLALGVRLPPRQPVPAECGIANVLVQAERSGVLTHTRFLDHLADDDAVFLRGVTVAAGEPVTCARDGFPTVIAELAVRGGDVAAARDHAAAVVAALRIPYA
jgi:carnosine synthase